MTNAFKYGGVDFTESEFLEAEKNNPERYNEMKDKIKAWEEKYPNYAKGDTSKTKKTPSGGNNQNEEADNYKYFDPVEGVFTNTPNKNTIELKTDKLDINNSSNGEIKLVGQKQPIKNENTVGAGSKESINSSIQRLKDKLNFKKYHDAFDFGEEVSIESNKTEKTVEEKFDKYGRWINPNFKDRSDR